VSPKPSGSTTVEISLVPEGAGTQVHVVHCGLAGPMADAHAGGWSNYLGRLAALAAERVPTAAQLGLS
jgi:hypothetical protein